MWISNKEQNHNSASSPPPPSASNSTTTTTVVKVPTPFQIHHGNWQNALNLWDVVVAELIVREIIIMIDEAALRFMRDWEAVSGDVSTVWVRGSSWWALAAGLDGGEGKCLMAVDEAERPRFVVTMTWHENDDGWSARKNSPLYFFCIIEGGDLLWWTYLWFWINFLFEYRLANIWVGCLCLL